MYLNFAFNRKPYLYIVLFNNQRNFTILHQDSYQHQNGKLALPHMTIIYSIYAQRACNYENPGLYAIMQSHPLGSSPQNYSQTFNKLQGLNFIHREHYPNAFAFSNDTQCIISPINSICQGILILLPIDFEASYRGTKFPSPRTCIHIPCPKITSGSLSDAEYHSSLSITKSITHITTEHRINPKNAQIRKVFST